MAPVSDVHVRVHMFHRCIWRKLFVAMRELPFKRSHSLPPRQCMCKAPRCGPRCQAYLRPINSLTCSIAERYCTCGLRAKWGCRLELCTRPRANSRYAAYQLRREQRRAISLPVRNRPLWDLSGLIRQQWIEGADPTIWNAIHFNILTFDISTF